MRPVAGWEPAVRIRGRNATKADLVVGASGGRLIAVKDYSTRPWIVRQTIGRLLVRREVAAYAAAQGAPGLPSFLGRAGRFALALEWLPSRSLASRAGEHVDPSVFDRLTGIVRALHERGIALGDLHHRDVLVADDGEVHVVDLATAWILGPHPGRFRRAVFERLREQDLVAVARMRARWTSTDETAAIRSVGATAAARHARARRLKRAWDVLRGRR